MKLNLKKRRKPDACDVMRCRQRDHLVIVEDGVKLCPNHLAEYNADDDAPAPVPAGVAAYEIGEAPSDAVAVSQSAVLATVEPVRAEAVAQFDQLAAIEITTQGALDSAGAFLQDVKGRAKALEQQRTSVTKPLLDAKRNIDAWFKPAKEALGKLESHLKSAISGYVTAQEQARLAALQAGEHEQALAVEQPTLPTGIQTRTIWRFEIEDAALIPREYLVPDAAKIAAHVNAYKSQSQIPGVRAYPDTGVSSTASKAGS